MYWACAALC